MTIKTGPKARLLVSAAPGEGYFNELTRLLRGIDALLAGCRVISQVESLPTVFTDGDMYLITAGENTNRIARYSIDPQSYSGWEFYTPFDGMRVWSTVDQKLYRYVASSTSYVEEGSGGGGMSNPMTTSGDIIVGGVGGAPGRMGRGSPRQSLRIAPTGTGLQWFDDNQLLAVACSDLVTDITAGTGKAYIDVPYNITLTEVQASLLVAQPGGAIFTVDVNANNTSILGTKLTIDNTEVNSITADIQPTISTASLTKGQRITFDVDQVGSAGARGLIVTLIGKPT